MSSSKAFFAIGAIAMAALVVGVATPSYASPIGTTYDFTTVNFQGDGGLTGIPFGGTTSIPGSGVSVTSAVSTSSTIPGLTTGGLDLVEFLIETDDSGFINGDSASHSTWVASGLNWGPGSDPGVGEFLIFLSFSADGSYVSLDGTGLGVPIVPNPGTLAFGADAIPIDITGDPVDPVIYDTATLTGVTSLTSFLALGLSFAEALSVDAMHVSFEVTHVPEPATIALAGLGLCSTLMIRRRK